MARLFYPLLFLATTALAAALWVRHDSQNAWLSAASERIFRLLGASEARAQTYPVAGTAGARATAGGGASASAAAAPPYTAPAERPETEPSYPRTAAIEPRSTAQPFDPSRYPPQGAPPRGAQDSAEAVSDGARLYVPDPQIGPVPNGPAPPGTPPINPLREIPHAKIIARVGGEVILAGELLGAVNETLAKNADKIPPEHIEAYRDAVMQKLLVGLLETKIVVAAAKQKIGEEGLPKVMERLEAAFERERMKELMQGVGAKSRYELDAYLRQKGTSLDREKRAFCEQTLATQWIRQHLNVDEEISHEDMLAYYEQHLASYEFPTQARWEQLMVKTSNYRSKDEAFRALAQMGNQVLDGAPLADVAKSRSDGPTAHQGGSYDWTTKGSLVSEVLDQALFTLPIGALSPILEDDRGFSIIRVLERKQAGRVPFTEVQPQIKKLLRNERLNKQARDYLTELAEETQVWTIYDDQPPPDAPAPRAARRPTPSRPAPR